MTDDDGSAGFDIASPKPEALIESLRAFGYSTPAAIADLVDNSLSAGARSVWIDCHWAGSRSWFRVRDDGSGMTEGELKEAMRAGSQSPRDVRASTDLGRFGLGLKTASFSQCRLLTVASRKAKVSSVRQWDLDVVVRSSEWRLLKAVSRETAELLDFPGDTGTVVVWQEADRVVGDVSVDDPRARDRFLRMEEDIDDHLGSTFHRFLSGPGAVSIYVNGNRVRPWDPFMTAHPATQPMPEETLWFKDQAITVKPFILPHHSKLSPEEQRRGAGSAGWNAQQGFYIYRNRRLIVAGSWLGLGFQKEEHAKLARIRVDLPNTLDEAWQLDVRKASARPPGPVRDDFRRIARASKDRAVEVYRFRGKAIARSSTAGTSFVWNREDVRGKLHYRLNRDHPAVAALLGSEATLEMRASALRLVEETVPVPLIAIDHSESGLRQAGPLEGCSVSEIEALIVTVRASLAGSGLSSERITQMLLSTEPFDKYPELVAAVGTDSTGSDRAGK
jgi:hypothetical protein